MAESANKVLGYGEKFKALEDSLNFQKKLIEASRNYISPFTTLDKVFPSYNLPPLQSSAIPTPEKANDFQSASLFLRRLAKTIKQWRAQLPQDVQPRIIAILHGGIQIEVDRLAEESFHGIRVEGTMADSPCMVLAHQATVQLLCYVQSIESPERPRRLIGFVFDGEESEV